MDKRVGKLSFVYDEDIRDYVMSLEWVQDIGAVIFDPINKDLSEKIGKNLDGLTDIIREAYDRTGLDISNIF